MKRRVPLEKAEQAAGVKLLRSLGAEVYTLGTTRPRGDHPGTCQSAGLPDVFAFIGRNGTGSSSLLCWEVKRQTGGRESEEQRRFRELCELSNTAHVLGSCDDLIAWLIEHGYLRAAQVAAHHLRSNG